MTVRVPEIDVLALWIADGRSRAVDALAPGELGGLPHRTRSLLCAIIDGTAYLERRIRPGVGDPLGRHLVEVYAIDTAYADNTYGRSTVSAPRMAALLGLHERTVRRIRDMLVQLQLQGRERGGRSGDRHWPIIPRVLATARVTSAWWLDATSSPRTEERIGNPDTHGRPDLACGYPPAYPDTPPPISGHGRPISGHGAYAPHSDISALAALTSDKVERESLRDSLSTDSMRAGARARADAPRAPAPAPHTRGVPADSGAGLSRGSERRRRASPPSPEPREPDDSRSVERDPPELGQMAEWVAARAALSPAELAAGRASAAAMIAEQRRQRAGGEEGEGLGVLASERRGVIDREDG